MDTESREIAEGVDVRPKTQVGALEAGEKGKVNVVLSDQSKVAADHVVLAVGIKPAVVSSLGLLFNTASFVN